MKAYILTRCGWDAKKLGQKLQKSVQMSDKSEDLMDFQDDIKACIKAKIMSDKKLKAELKKSTLPFKHYYVYGGNVTDLPQYQWITDFIDEVRNELKMINKGESVLPKAEVFVIKGYGQNTEYAFNAIKALPDWRYAYYNSGRKEITMGMDYEFSGEMRKAIPWDTKIKGLVERINTDFGFNMNSAYLNYYKNGNDSIGFHSDKEKQVDHINQPVISISYGAARNFWFCDIKTGEEFPILLEDGDLCIMGKDSQIKYLHGIKKDGASASDERISITFRHMKY